MLTFSFLTVSVLSPLGSASSEPQVHTPIFTQLARTWNCKNRVYTIALNKIAGMHKTSVSSSWISNISIINWGLNKYLSFWECEDLSEFVVFYLLTQKQAKRAKVAMSAIFTAPCCSHYGTNWPWNTGRSWYFKLSIQGIINSNHQMS